MQIGATSDISLDWDNITWNECLRRISKIKENKMVESLELRMSALSGFHIYITLYFQVAPEHQFRLRRAWKDDGHRLMMDCFYRFNNKKDNSTVMFTEKRNIRYGVVWVEIPICLFKRKAPDSQEWHKITLQQDSAKKQQLSLVEL